MPPMLIRELEAARMGIRDKTARRGAYCVVSTTRRALLDDEFRMELE